MQSVEVYLAIFSEHEIRQRSARDTGIAQMMS